MSFPSQNEVDRNQGAIEAERLLRLIATLPAPEGVEARVKAGLHAAPRRGNVIRWPFSRAEWMRGSAVRAAAAAAIVVVVTGGGWEVYSHIRVAPVPAAIAAPQPIGGSTGFSTAGARRTPQTLDRPLVAVPVIEKQKTDGARLPKHPMARKKSKPAASTAPR